jgi:hypothetical protein
MRALHSLHQEGKIAEVIVIASLIEERGEVYSSAYDLSFELSGVAITVVDQNGSVLRTYLNGEIVD